MNCKYGQSMQIYFTAPILSFCMIAKLHCKHWPLKRPLPFGITFGCGTAFVKISAGNYMNLSSIYVAMWCLSSFLYHCKGKLDFKHGKM